MIFKILSKIVEYLTWPLEIVNHVLLGFCTIGIKCDDVTLQIRKVGQACTQLARNTKNLGYFVNNSKTMLKYFFFLLSCFLGSESFSSSRLYAGRSISTELNGYVPSGFTPESYKKFKEEEAKKTAKKNLGKLGPRGFQSRSMQSFQEAMERGEATHLLPVFNAKERVAKGELKVEDIPVSFLGSHSLDRTFQL